MTFYTYYIVLFFLVLTSCKSVYTITEVKHVSIQLDATVNNNLAIEKLILPYKTTLDTTMNEIVCRSNKLLNKAKPESTLGNLLADATFYEAEKHFNLKPDLAIVNYGGIRIPSLPKGEITLGKIYELMPFDNYIDIVYVNGTVLESVCNLIARKGGWPVKGITFTILNEKAINIKIQNIPLDKNKVYKLALSDYLANGGDNMSMLKDLRKDHSNLLLRDAFINYFKQMQSDKNFIDSNLENRIIVK